MPRCWSILTVIAVLASAIGCTRDRSRAEPSPLVDASLTGPVASRERESESVPDGAAGSPDSLGSGPWHIRPAGGSLVARQRFHPRIEVGTSGIIIAHAAPTPAAPPVYASSSECDWSESVTVLTWKQLDAPEQPSPADATAAPCSKSRPGFLPYLEDLQFEPLAIVCDARAGYSCQNVTLQGQAPPAFGLEARFGAPRLAAYYANYLGPELRLGVLGAQLVGNRLTATATRIGDAPTSQVLADPVPVPCAAPQACHLSVVPDPGDDVRVELIERTGKKLEVWIDQRGRPTGKKKVSQETDGDPTRSDILAIDDQGRLVRRYHLTTRTYDAPLGGSIGRPVTSYGYAVDTTDDGGPTQVLAWIEGDSPRQRLRIARLPIVIAIDWSIADPVVDVASGALGTVSIASLSDHLGIAWSERDGDAWVVRAAEVVATSATSPAHAR
jgi:hypothetical protein